MTSDEPSTRGREPILNLPPVITYLMLAMIAVFVVCVVGGLPVFYWVIDTFGFIPARYAVFPGEQPAAGVLGLIWPFVTHLFVHGSVMHIFFNVLWLLAVGTPVARRLGAWQFLVFFFTCGVLGAATHLAAHYGDPTPVVGASGAVSACMGAVVRLIFSPSARYFVIRGVALGQLAPILDRRVVTFSVVWFVINFLFGSGLLPMPGAEGAQIAWEAHVGGYFAGLFLISFFDRFATGLDNLFQGFDSQPPG